MAGREGVEVYVAGTGKAPPWAAKRLMPYLRADGEIGYEYHGNSTIWSMVAGDSLVKCGYYIRVKRKGTR
jgi:hypothetical protein